MTSFHWGAPPAPETTLILPNNINLDESVVASLPKSSPRAVFRVKKESRNPADLELLTRKRKFPVGPELFYQFKSYFTCKKYSKKRCYCKAFFVKTSACRISDLENLFKLTSCNLLEVNNDRNLLFKIFENLLQQFSDVCIQTI